MNPIDDQLNRLFRAAAKGTPVPDIAPPFGMETRVMAAWRAGRNAPGGFWDGALLMRGLIAAAIIMAISFLPALSSTSSNPFADFLQLTDSTVSTDDAQ
jgi:hypothetical protein